MSFTTSPGSMRPIGPELYVEAMTFPSAPRTNWEGWMMPRRSSHHAPMRSASSRVAP
jgi:hypothetical protein